MTLMTIPGGRNMSWKKHISNNLLLTLVLSQVSAADTAGSLPVTPNGPGVPIEQAIQEPIFTGSATQECPLTMATILGPPLQAQGTVGRPGDQPVLVSAIGATSGQPVVPSTEANARPSRTSSRARSSTASNGDSTPRDHTPREQSTSSRGSTQNTLPIQLSEYLNKGNLKGYSPFGALDNSISFMSKMEASEWLSRMPNTKPQIDVSSINNFTQKVLCAMWGNKILTLVNGVPVTWKPNMGYESNIYLITRLPHNDWGKRDGLAAYAYNQCIPGTYLTSHLFSDRFREVDRRLDIGTEATILGLAHILQKAPQLPEHLKGKYFFITSAREVVILNDNLSDFDLIVGINGGSIKNDEFLMPLARISIAGSPYTIDFPIKFIRESISWKKKYTLINNKLFTLNNVDLINPDLQMVCVDMFIQPNQAVKRCHLIELLAYQYTGSLVANTSNFDNFNFKVVPIDSNENLFRLVLTDFANISVIDGIPAIYDQNDNSRIMFKGNIMDALENYVTKSIKNQFPPRTGFGFPQRVTFA